MSDNHRQLQVTAIHAGPLPPPKQLSEYEEICPGAAERIIQMAESQITHRQELEKLAANTNARNSLLGICCGFIKMAWRRLVTSVMRGATPSLLLT